MSDDSKHETGRTSQGLHILLQQREKFLAFVARRVESREVAEDILQSAFLRGREKESLINDQSLTAWFYRVLRNAVIDHYRRRAAAARATESLAGEFQKSHRPEVEQHK